MLAVGGLLLVLLSGPELAPTTSSLETAGGVAERLDAKISATWQLAHGTVTALPVCDDATFLRRVWLDLTGRVPPAAEVSKLLRAKAPLDRAALVNRLLDAPEFATYWGRQWSEYLLGRRPFEEGEFSGRGLQRFLRESLAKRTPYNQIVQELITAEGAMDETGAVNFLLRYQAEPTPVAGAVSQKILGLSLQCAECHDHPHAAWKQVDFWGLSAFFARLRRMNPANPKPNEQFSAVIERPRGEFLVVDKKGTPDPQGNFPTRTVMPQFPGVYRREILNSRRTALAAWITAPENPYFARHAVNQTWKRLFEDPLVLSFDPPLNPVAAAGSATPLPTTTVEKPLRSPPSGESNSSKPADPTVATKPAPTPGVAEKPRKLPPAGAARTPITAATESNTPATNVAASTVAPLTAVEVDRLRSAMHQEILEILRDDFVRSGFDFQRLLTVICLSETYQRSSGSDDDDSTRPGAAPSSASALTPQSEEALYARRKVRPLNADQLHGSLGQAFGYFHDENDHRLAKLTDEEFTQDIPANSFGTESQSLGRALALYNGEHLRGAVDFAAESLIRSFGDAAGPDHLQQLFLALLSRPPTIAELDLFLELAGHDIPQRGLEDAAWMILNSAEFLTNH